MLLFYYEFNTTTSSVDVLLGIQLLQSMSY